MIQFGPSLFLPKSEIKISYIRSPGPGGQNVNKLATAAQLRFNVLNSPSLPESVRGRLIASLRKRITAEGEIIIKASRFRTQERNKQDAIDRLVHLLKPAAIPPKKRKKTKPSLAVREKRLTQKKLHAKTKASRRAKPTKEW